MSYHPSFSALDITSNWILVTGPSGCGKSALVEDLAFQGLERITVDGDWFGHRDQKKRWDWNHDAMKWLKLSHPNMIWVGCCDKLVEFGYLFNEVYVIDTKPTCVAVQGCARDIEENRLIRKSFDCYKNHAIQFYAMCRLHADWHFCSKSNLIEILVGLFFDCVDKRLRESLGNRDEVMSQPFSRGPGCPFFD